MHLSDDMRAELDQRRARIATEQPDDSAFRDVPATDLFWKLAFVVCAIVGTVWMQAR